MSWKLHIGKSARKSLKRFPKKDQKRIINVLREFVVNPYGGDIEKMAGEINVWRRRIGSYRIFYEVMIKEKIIYIFEVKRRTSSTYSVKLKFKI